MDENLKDGLIVVGITTLLGALGWFLRGFFRWPSSDDNGGKIVIDNGARRSTDELYRQIGTVQGTVEALADTVRDGFRRIDATSTRHRMAGKREHEQLAERISRVEKHLGIEEKKK